MTIRSTKERALQTAAFEGIGIVAVSPIYAYVAQSAMIEGVALIMLLSAVILIWSPVFNTLFDRIEFALVSRPASERPHHIRIVHAITHEVSAVMLTCPILMWVGGHSLASALAFNLGLTIVYTAYTYAFHLAYDHLRPIGAPPKKMPEFRMIKNGQAIAR